MEIIHTWVCSQCTALNQISYNSCSVCGYTKQTHEENLYCLMSCKHIRIGHKKFMNGSTELMITTYSCSFFQVALKHEDDDLFKPVVRFEKCTDNKI